MGGRGKEVNRADFALDLWGWIGEAIFAPTSNPPAPGEDNMTDLRTHHVGLGLSMMLACELCLLGSFRILQA